MKDFSKKFISTAMAIAVMASMSAYAEGNVQTEEVKATNAAVESTCDHFNVTTTSSMSPINYSHHYVINSGTCLVTTYTITYTTTCSKCGAVIKSWSEPRETHSISHKK